MVGNSVSVPVAQWIGGRLADPGRYDSDGDRQLMPGERWPKAAWSMGDGVHVSRASDTPVWLPRPPLLEFLQFPTKPLSERAATGFLRRAEKASLRFAPGFLDKVRAHAVRMGGGEYVAPAGSAGSVQGQLHLAPTPR